MISGQAREAELEADFLSSFQHCEHKGEVTYAASSLPLLVLHVCVYMQIQLLNWSARHKMNTNFVCVEEQKSLLLMIKFSRFINCEIQLTYVGVWKCGYRR